MPKNLLDNLEAEQELALLLEEFIQDFVKFTQAFFDKKKMVDTGKLKNSFEYEIETNPRKTAIELLVSFPDYGRYLDIKRLQSAKGGTTYVDAIEAWVKRHGFDKKWAADYLKKYNLKKIPKNIANRLAWGIVRNRAKLSAAQQNKQKRAWYTRRRTGAFYGLYSQIARELPRIVGVSMKKELVKLFDERNL